MTDAWKLPAYTRLPSGCGFSTTLPDFDFETYSEAGYIFDPHAKGGIGKWNSITRSPPFGLGAVGAPVYAEHPSTEVLSLAYNLKDGTGEHLWVPGLPPPQNLFDHIERGGLLEAWNSAFEYHIWFNVCMKRMGWPAIHFRQLRDAMAKSRAHAMPGALGEAAAVYGGGSQKLAEGKRLISKFSKPRQPSKNDRRTRNTPRDHPVDAGKFYEYNIGDIRAEADMSAFLPDLSDAELELWLTDQAINFRGVSIDMEAVENCIEIVRQAQARYNAELCELTEGAVTDATKLDALKAWLSTRNIIAPSLAEAPLAELLENPLLAPDIRRALEIRQLLGSESVKKLFSIQRRTSRDGRLRDLFAYCGADRTGRWAGRGPQPQNLPNSGPKVRRCDAIAGCGKHYHASLDACPWCGNPCAFSEAAEWGVGAVDDCLEAIATGVLGEVERCFGDATTAISGCLRGMFCAAEGHDLICSDYSAIEAVVLAMLAGEQWRIDVFNTHGKIYEMSASTITGVPFAEFERHVEETGQHHPLRKKIGKVAELASGYQGSVGAWKQFGAEEHFESDDEILQAVRAWRKASPQIVKFWYGLEDAARAAIQQPGRVFQCQGIDPTAAGSGITYHVQGDVLYCTLLSGRRLAYHKPRLVADRTPFGREVLKITYEGYNSDYKKGPKGWLRLDTYGGKLAENVTQATARDILAPALVNLERAQYPVVLHIHDEVVCEVPDMFGSVAEVERIMATLPDWARGWPIRAAGGWRGKRYRKD